MPKKQSQNAFFFYMLHFKDQQARKRQNIPGGLREISKMASESWNTMNAQQRGPFEKQAKEAKFGPKKEVEKYTSQGIPLSVMEKEQNDKEDAKNAMLRRIKEIVKNAFENNAMGSEEFYFISGVYFLKENENEKYLPAELALVKYTFESGIVAKYHTYINPGQVPMGYSREAKELSDTTHRLPIPPAAKGERNYKVILNEIDAFMGSRSELAPLFTIRDQIPIITSFINQFCSFANVDANRYTVYPLHQIFYDIKEEAVKNSISGQSLKSIHIAEALLNRDNYAYQSNMACNYHDEHDCSLFCALTNVTKWSHIFTDNICVDLGIDPENREHFPSEIDTANTSTNTFPAAAETQSAASTSAPSTSTAMSHCGRQQKTPDSSIDADSYACGNRRDSNKDEDFPPLGNRDNTCNRRGGDEREEEFPSLGSSHRRTDSSSKRSNDRDYNEPLNTSSSSGSYHWKNDQRLSEPDDLRRPFGRGKLADNGHSAMRGMGRGSSLYLSEASFGTFGRGRPK